MEVPCPTVFQTCLTCWPVAKAGGLMLIPSSRTISNRYLPMETCCLPESDSMGCWGTWALEPCCAASVARSLVLLVSPDSLMNGDMIALFKYLKRHYMLENKELSQREKLGTPPDWCFTVGRLCNFLLTQQCVRSGFFAVWQAQSFWRCK